MQPTNRLLTIATLSLTALMSIPLHGEDSNSLDPVVERVKKLGGKVVYDGTSVVAVTVNCRSLLDVYPVTRLSDLKELQLGGSVTHLGPLGRLSKLESLALETTAVTDLSPLTELPGLRHLRIRSDFATDITPLSKLPALETLDLQCHRVNELSPLTSLKNLEELTLHYLAAKDLGPVGELTNLRKLTVYGVLETSDPLSVDDWDEIIASSSYNIEPLSALTQLEELRLICTQVSDISALASLPHLRTLVIDNGIDIYVTVAPGATIADLSPLRNVKTLERLTLANTNVSKADLAALREAIPECRVSTGGNRRR